MVEDLAEMYRLAMLPHRFGYALYEPAPFKVLRPGMLGYLDEYRLWHPILDLSDPALVEAAGYTTVEYPVRSDPDPKRWGPLKSSHVVDTSINLSADIDTEALGLPDDIGGVVKYHTGADFGAVLMCDNEVVAEGYEIRNPFKEWLKENAKRLVKNHPDLRDYGVCVVTGTYSSTDIHITAWDNPHNEVALGFKTGATAIGSINPEISWLRGRSSSHWSAWDDQKRVLFFTGVKIKFSLFSVGEEREVERRGFGNKFIIHDLADGKSCEAVIELFGDPWKEVKKDKGL
jgi:hypothetical protein